MIEEYLSTLKIHKLTKEQYERELEAGRVDPSALYLTPDDESNGVYVQNEEPYGAPNGSLWVDLDAIGSGGGSGGVSSWNDLTDKPFGEVGGKNTVSLANNLVAFHNAGPDEYFKVSDGVITAADITSDAFLAYYDSGVDMIITSTDLGAFLWHEAYSDPGVLEVVAMSYADATKYYTIAQFRPTGVYFRRIQVDAYEMYPITITLPNCGKFSVSRTIDTKYLPESLRFGDVSGVNTWELNGNIMEIATDIIYDSYNKYFKISDAILTEDNFDGTNSVTCLAPGDATYTDYSYGFSQKCYRRDDGVIDVVYLDEYGNSSVAVYCYPEGLDHDPGIYVRDDVVGVSFGNFDGFTVNQSMNAKLLPKAEAVSNATGSTVTTAKFNELLTALRNAGYLAE